MSLIHENISFTAREKPPNTNENSLEIFAISAAKFCSNYHRVLQISLKLTHNCSEISFLPTLSNFREFRQITFAFLLHNTVGN